jgi:hypothetical protein
MHRIAPLPSSKAVIPANATKCLEKSCIKM